MIQSPLQENLSEVIRVLKKRKVKKAYAFGSVCSPSFRKDSDIDLLISFEPEGPFEGYSENFWALEDELKEILNREIELVPEHTLRNPYFIDRINKTKVLLYE
ncbi:MAG: nucleotidyltransferase domain-containing protein [Cyclobacteriaceae bacterium]|nr:nucleotidyltransferase domain-containing protein [Cyclobacteriaceae bacterium]